LSIHAPIETKGFGFIMPDEGDKDVFVHISAVQAAGLATLKEDQKIEYELHTDESKNIGGGS